MVWPVPGYGVNQPFGIRGEYWRACGWHTGADIAAPRRTKIIAPVSGTIRHRDYGSWAGKFQFVISPSPGQPFADGEILFAHTMDRLPDGTEVKYGDVIARVGSEGNATGPHLHGEWHTIKQAWHCGIMRDPVGTRANPGPFLWQPAGAGWKHPSGTKVYARYVKVDGHELNDDRHSISIECVQEMLKKHGVGEAARNLPITGKYWTQTDQAVRDDQSAHGTQFGQSNPDTAMKSNVGPMQFEHLKKATGAPYVYVPDESPPEKPTDPEKPVVHKPFLAASLDKLRDEIDARWPDRSRKSDGWIGNEAHQKTKSEHNPVGHENGPEHGTPGAVHALDITASGIEADAVVAATIGDHRLWYIIYDGHIYSKTYGWAKRPYTGDNPHTTHIHFSLAADDRASAVRNELDEADWLPVSGKPVDPPPSGGQYVTMEEYAAFRRAVADDLFKLAEDIGGGG